MSKRNLNSLDLILNDNSIETVSCSPFFEERSKTQSHESRFKVKENNFTDFENSQNLTENEEN